jgi:hypothetical protein
LIYFAELSMRLQTNPSNHKLVIYPKKVKQKRDGSWLVFVLL